MNDHCGSPELTSGRVFRRDFSSPFAAGNFIYSAATDLIPEIKNEGNATLSASLFS
jgi:zinc transporter ZupT